MARCGRTQWKIPSEKKISLQKNACCILHQTVLFWARKKKIFHMFIIKIHIHSSAARLINSPHTCTNSHLFLINEKSPPWYWRPFSLEHSHSLFCGHGYYFYSRCCDCILWLIWQHFISFLLSRVAHRKSRKNVFFLLANKCHSHSL